MSEGGHRSERIEDEALTEILWKLLMSLCFSFKQNKQVIRKRKKLDEIEEKLEELHEILSKLFKNNRSVI